MENKLTKPIAILGVGSFGTVLANLVSKKREVIVYARKTETISNINNKKLHRGITINENVFASDNLAEVAKKCDVIIPVVPSYAFRSLIKEIAPFLESQHILIHATKGFDVKKEMDEIDELFPEDISTMSEVILDETPVYRVGCLSGPNLSKEIAEGQPAGTVLASKFDEVIDIGVELFDSHNFQVYRSNDIKGIELAGIFKNYIAIASGGTSALGYGENVKGLLITKGISEMVTIGNHLGVNPRSFLGLAGIGDLVATCNSTNSRNYTVGYRLGSGETLTQIMETMTEAAEGIKTTRVIKKLVDTLKIQAPLVNMIYKVLYEDYSLEAGIKLLMRLSVGKDVEF